MSSHQWYLKNKEKVKARSRAWRASNYDHYLAYQKTYNEVNREKNAEVTKAWIQRNLNRKHATDSAWQKANPEKHGANNKKYRSTPKGIETLRRLRIAYAEKHNVSNRRWRKEHVEQCRETMRLVKEKRRQLPPIGLILNDKSPGLELHHTGLLASLFDSSSSGYVGVYIPKSMNRGHCAQTGKERNLDRVNVAAIEFLFLGFDK